MSPVSFGTTLGRELRLGVDVFEAELAGFGRRWNYGVMHSSAWSTADDGSEREWTIVALGVMPSVGETVNGVVAWVGEHELAQLDHRERHYDRVDVTSAIAPFGDAPGAPHVGGGRVVTYVPREVAVRHYEQARDRRGAVIEQRYWNLVDAAFAALGRDRRERYHATTPPPDVPVLDVRRERSRHAADSPIGRTPPRPAGDGLDAHRVVTGEDVARAVDRGSSSARSTVPPTGSSPELASHEDVVVPAQADTVSVSVTGPSSPTSTRR